MRKLAFVHASDGSLPVCWTAYPVEAPSVVAWYGGPDAALLASQPKAEIESRVIAGVAQRFHLSRRRLESHVERVHMHNWMTDPHSRGAYSYVAVGGVGASEELARPIRGTLFFAGEAADAQGRNGTVEGAIATGMSSAKAAHRALIRAR